MRFDADYENSSHIPRGDTYAARWVQAAAAFRTSAGPSLHPGLRYGPDAAQWFDLFLPPDAPLGVMVFVHGGYWMAFGPRDWSHLAAGALARGWAVALPGYTLAPAARIAQMTREVAQAVTAIAGRVGGPIIVTGHSAGGHLAARMGNADAPLAPAIAMRIARIVPIAPLADLRPLLDTTMNATLHLDGAGARAESPALQPPRRGLRAHVWVGAAERPAFLDQARRLGNAWSCPVTRAPGRHHFDVIEGLEHPDSALMRVLLD